MFDATGRWLAASPNQRAEHSQVRFNPDHFGSFTEVKESARSNPNSVLLIACSDHFEGPQNISGIPFERLLVIQTLAASIAHREEQGGSQELSLILNEYPIKHVIVCGHLGCGVIRHWLRKQDRSKRNAGHSPSHHPSQLGSKTAFRMSQVRNAVESYTTMQLINLQSHLPVQRRLQSGQLKMHGWLADDRTASVKFFHPGRRGF